VLKPHHAAVKYLLNVWIRMVVKILKLEEESHTAAER
jgi:hypothetical protein